MSHRTKTLLPTTANLLRPQITKDQHQKLLFKKERQAKYHNGGATELFSPQQSSSLANGACCVPMQQKSGNKAITPAKPTACSSPAQTSRDGPLSLDPISSSSAQSQFVTTRSGRQVKRPSHLKDFVSRQMIKNRTVIDSII